MMRKITLRSLRAHPVRFIATMLAVIFGTAFLSGALVLKESVSTTFENNTTAALRGVDAAVVPDAKRAEEALVQDPTVPADLLTTVQGVPGVRVAAGVLSGQMSLLDGAGFVVKPKGTGYLRIDDAKLNPYTLVSGRWPERSGEVALDVTTAKERNITAEGRTVEVATTTGKQTAKVVGTVSYLTLGRKGDAPNFIVTKDDAFAWLKAGESRYQAILVSADEGAVAATVTRLKVLGLGLGVEGTVPAKVQSGDEYRTEQAGAAAGLAIALGIGLTAFAYVALFICIFIVYNTFTTVIAQRTRELALLRAIGARGSQVGRAVLFESVVVGVVGSLTGIVIGIGLALLLCKAAPGLASAGSGGDINLAVNPTVLLLFVLVPGLFITVVSALVPAWRAARVKPLEAMRRVSIDRTGGNRARARIGAALTLVGVLWFVLSLVSKSRWFLLPGPGFLFLGLLFGGPKLASLFARGAAPAVGARRSVSARLATDSLHRNPRRAATTANALVIGVFLVVFVTAAGGALRDFAVDFISQFGGADLNVASESNTVLPAGLGEQIRATPGVRDVTAIYGNFGRAIRASNDCASTEHGSGGPQFPAAAADLNKAQSALGLELKGGKPFDQIGRGEAALGDFSQFGGGAAGGGGPLPGLGSEMKVCYANGIAKTYKVVTLMKFSFTVPPLLISPEDARSVDPNLELIQYSLNAEPGQAAAVKARLDRMTNSYSNVLVYEGSAIVQFLKDFFNGLISAVNALLGAAIVVAIFGIVNTLMLAITERTQEIGLLRAVGMTRRQLRATIRTEAVLVSLLGTLLGVAFGLFVAYCVATSLIQGRGGGFSWPIRELVSITVAGVVVGVLASIIPATRAARLDILEATQDT